MPFDSETDIANTSHLTNSGIDLDQVQPVNRRRILVIDDEPDTITLLKHIFINEGYNVAGALSGKEAVKKVLEVNPSIIILDLLMPEMNGTQTFEAIKKIVDVPVIMLSAVSQKEEIVRLLQKGVDDYITKPFNSAEVTARVQAVLRRAEKPVILNVLSFPNIDLIIDLETYEVTYKNTRIQLTGKMFEVLALLAKAAPKVVNYQELTEKVWGENSPSVRNRLKYLIYLLRQEFLKIDENLDLIENIDRLGYKLAIGN
jgi:two-component system KDP operon response regulator KdpE